MNSKTDAVIEVEYVLKHCEDEWFRGWMLDLTNSGVRKEVPVWEVLGKLYINVDGRKRMQAIDWLVEKGILNRGYDLAGKSLRLPPEPEFQPGDVMMHDGDIKQKRIVAIDGSKVIILDATTLGWKNGFDRDNEDEHKHYKLLPAKEVRICDKADKTMAEMRAMVREFSSFLQADGWAPTADPDGVVSTFTRIFSALLEAPDADKD